MPGKRVTDHRVIKYEQYRQQLGQQAAVWDAVALPMLRAAPGLTAVTVLEELQRRYPGDYPNVVLRTLQRLVRRCRAFEGPEREVLFAQQHDPGRMGLSDFTHAGDQGARLRRWHRGRARRRVPAACAARCTARRASDE